MARRLLADAINTSPRVLARQAFFSGTRNSPRALAQRKQLGSMFGDLSFSPATSPVIQRKTWREINLADQVRDARARMEFTDEDDILHGLSAEEKVRLQLRVESALYRLELGLKHDWVGTSQGDLEKDIGALLATKPNRKPDEGETNAQVVAKQISEKLSELEHAGDVVLRSRNEIALSPVFIGIRGPKDEQEKRQMPDVASKDIIGREFSLPSIDEPQLEADVYYRDGDGIVHVVEVKDSVNALRTKLGEKNQYQRQIRWLSKRTDKYGRVVEYFIQSPTPFHRLLDEAVLGPFGEVEAAQNPQDKPWIKLGDETFTYPDFVGFYKQAMAAFTPKMKAYRLGPRKKVGEFLDKYFGTKELARASIARPDTMVNI